MQKGIIITILLFSLVSCKKDIVNNKDFVLDSLQNGKMHAKIIFENKDLNQSITSFTIDCGSGCAMTYNEVSRKKNKNSVEIKYNVTQYINENPQDEYFETYVFENDGNELLKSIHLNSDALNILNDDDSLLKSELSKVGIELFPKGIVNQNTSNNLEVVTEKAPYNLISVPFDLKSYIKNLPNEIKNSYTPTSKLIDYLVSKGYEGETYKCFFLNTDDKSKKIIASIARGDSEYFVLITILDNKFSSFNEIGSIGEETKYFKIDNNYKVLSY
ncbi:hypothetical protein [Flavobacterium terrae]|uniref:Uncharacterized protein n=1 Tax=Flavobacterium terrae TaxID=415425 RepID=A0A1M6F0S5_9FLAO|nr:hypothetical protein [Flavobacterium terrae]SHI91334.1 hypothetical protein SAMN05444363_2075 [Flavobacterium terrae]